MDPGYPQGLLLGGRREIRNKLGRGRMEKGGSNYNARRFLGMFNTSVVVCGNSKYLAFSRHRCEH